ncbi:MAG: hydrogenase maturation protease, partial [Anaerolineae bacterium]
MLTEALSTDTLPSFCTARVLILGVGNVLFGDDAFGPEVADYILRHYQIPDDMYVMDVGTGVRKLLFTLTLSEKHPEEIIVVDAVDWGQDLGQVSEISASDLPVTKIDDFSLHQVPTSNMLHELQERCGVKVSVIACDVAVMPGMIQPGMSDVVRTAVVTAAKMLAERYRLLPSTAV